MSAPQRSSRRWQPALPIRDWGSTYGRDTLRSDLMAALIVTVMLIPQRLAYALLAGLPPEAHWRSLEEQVQGVGGVDGLDSPQEAVVSPDGANVNVGSSFGGGATFLRNPSTGALTYLENPSLAGHALAVSPDGKNVYASVYSYRLEVWNRGALGALTFSQFDNAGAARDLAVSPDGKNVYAAGGVSRDEVVVFTRNPTTGTLSVLESKRDGVDGVDGIAGAYGVTVSPDGRNVYVVGTVVSGASDYRTPQCRRKKCRFPPELQT